LLVDINESSEISSDTKANTSMTTAALLDLYSGCGGMSTGLCMGTALAGLKTETVLFCPIFLLKNNLLIILRYVYNNFLSF
jgi:hypothetical protein